ncbi:MAG TPA: hypothetical protein DCW90_06380 [Lachnospiraceae bacterium]|nr:hypothetical protein [uncultured Lachnoclostridium sp.]HAU85125.1 hypothetical protein [Lachnospiraceae bacterium]
MNYLEMSKTEFNNTITEMTVPQLREVAKELDIEIKGVRRIDISQDLFKGWEKVRFSQKDEAQENEGQVRNFVKRDYDYTPRPSQVYIDEALEYEVINLLMDEDPDSGKKFLSRSDLILVFTVWKTLDNFLEEYKRELRELRDNKGYKIYLKPHWYLKSKID